MPPEHVINPFLLPQCGNGKPQLLCPWRIPDHSEYYAAIKGTERPFDEFVASVNDMAVLSDDGQMVLAVGGHGCGKTSLINRCVRHVQLMLPKEARALVVPVSNPIGGPTGLTNRMKFVCEAITDGLESDRVVATPEQIGRLNAVVDQPDRFYRKLGDTLDDAIVLIVLLPSTDLLDEILTYAQLVPRKTLLLIESASFSTKEDVFRPAGIKSVAAPMTLEVERIRLDEIRTFVRHRLDHPRHQGMVYPNVSDKALEWVRTLGFPYTIGLLQNVFASLYARLLENGADYDPSRDVTEQEITRMTMDILPGKGEPLS